MNFCDGGEPELLRHAESNVREERREAPVLSVLRIPIQIVSLKNLASSRVVLREIKGQPFIRNDIRHTSHKQTHLSRRRQTNQRR